MKKITLDVKKLCESQNAHIYLKKKFGFPDWYGENLDALYDMLGETAELTKVVFTNPAALETDTGKYAQKLLNVFNDAADGNPNLVIKLTRSGK